MSERRIIFVCTGNTCRSPMAEGIFRARLGDTPGITVESAGVMAADGMPVSGQSVDALKEIGIDIAEHRSRFLDPEMVEAADWLVVMTRSHRDVLLDAFPEVAEKTRLLASFGMEEGDADIADPYGGDLNVYRYTRDQIDGSLADFILFLRDRGEWGEGASTKPQPLP